MNMKSRTTFLHLWRITAISTTLAFAIQPASATKVTQQVCGRVFLKDGSIIEADGDNRIGTPKKKNGKVTVIENAFTHNSKETRVLEGAEIDSLQIWQRTRTDRVRTLVYIPGRGWGWKIESAGGITLYGYSPDGYYLAGNGGMSTRGKLTLLVVKDGHIYEYENTHKMADDSFRREITAFVADDPALTARIMESRKTKDATLRMLGTYRPSLK